MSDERWKDIPHQEEENMSGQGQSAGAEWQQGAGRQDPPPGWGPGPENSGGWGSTAEQKSAGLATVLSLLPGLGQIYVGFYQRGFLHMGVVAVTITLLNEWAFGPIHPLLGIFLPFFWIYNMIDAARCAQTVNRALRGGRPLDMPDLPMGLTGGNRLSGMILVAMGVLLLGVTVFDLSLWWLRDWWPLALIFFGLRLLLKDRSSR